MTTTAIATASPAEIDAGLFPILARRWDLAGRLSDAERKAQEEVTLSNRMVVERALRDLPGLEAALAAANDEAAPAMAEYDRRGGWTRYVVVPGGHLHRLACSTCRPTTPRVWISEASGMSAAEVVAAYSFTACTVCFPDAPVAPAPAPDPSLCSGSGQYVPDADFRLYSPRGCCPVCGRGVSVTSTGRARRHRP